MRVTLDFVLACGFVLRRGARGFIERPGLPKFVVSPVKEVCSNPLFGHFMDLLEQTPSVPKKRVKMF